MIDDDDDWDNKEPEKEKIESPIWADEWTWPEDDVQHVFLARAAQAVGVALFKENWTGEEPMAKMEVALPDHYRPDNLSNAQWLRAINLLKTHKPKSWKAAPPVRSFGLSLLKKSTNLSRTNKRGSLPNFKNSQWKAVVKIARKEDEDNEKKVDRWSKVQRYLVDRLKAGEIASFTRDLEGGPFNDVAASHWNTEAWPPRFESCFINPDAPFSPTDRQSSKYLFVSGAALDQSLRILGHSPQIDDAFIANLSPYMLAALDVARELNISPSNQPPIKGVKAAVRIALESIPNKPRDNAVSKKMVHSMATMLRTPESGWGKAKKS